MINDWLDENGRWLQEIAQNLEDWTNQAFVNLINKFFYFFQEFNMAKNR